MKARRRTRSRTRGQVQSRQQGPMRVSAERLTALLANLPGMAYRIRNDGQWSVEFISGRVEELTGYRAEELMGANPVIRPSEVLHAQDRERLWGEILAAIKAGRSYTVEYRARMRDGTEKWLWERGFAVRDAAGKIEAIESFVLDISERKRAEHELRDSERLRRLIIDNEPECVKMIAPDGTLLQMNPAGLAMLEAPSLEAACRQPLLDYIAPAHRAAFADLHHRVMRGESGSLEFEVIGLRGTRRWLDSHAVPMRDESGAVTALLAVTRDVTERRAQRERIARLSRMRAVMSSINALIVRTRNRIELFQEACRIVVEHGGFGLAWIGLIREGAELTPVAHYGDDGGHLKALRLRLDADDPSACIPTVQAAREGRPQLCNDVATDSAASGWREPLGALGFGSFVSMPLVHGGRVLGTFNLYAREPGAFDDEELKLLGELSRDIAYALEFIIRDETLDLLSIYDPLTRLPNRKLFMQRLPGFVDAARGSGLPLAVLMLDIERFKAINDAAGHAGGDELLKVVGERLKFHAGGQSYMARIAGDRFAAVIPELDRNTDLEALVKGAGWDHLDPPFRHGENEFPVTFKIGAALFPQDAADSEALLRNAELALKHGRATGRTFTRYTAAMGDVAARKLTLERQLRQALERRELEMHYQPKLDLRTGLVCGAEALLRWRSPDGAQVPPDVMIPLMEETGLIVEVGQWALEQALTDRAAWLADGLAAPGIGVNVSSAQVRETTFVDTVRAALTRHGAAAAGLELEVTESMMMADPDANVAKLRTLRELGVGIALDDFGTGYSSLAYLARLPLNAVKVDRSFVARMAEDRDTMTIVGAIVSLAHSMNLRVVAEGVETQEQLRFLQALRCDEIQGFLFSPALPAPEFAALIRSGRKLG